ncbi:hypothetical protein LX69_01933 [Breznakibacter xylanolyticus]|uniref:Uncharacterized protein n=1 Tax=Breznakibacter xylanolyticus TaxID=990 RepID=A0A2W7N8N1_9BACT|nr:hypothetical protein [Breznakibacter xylanolyticus]PZX16438.1 hypothetical protein LX69_01933 [Breznakibacter xylanolyticus]
MKHRLFDLNNIPLTDWLFEVNNQRLLCKHDQINFLPLNGIVNLSQIDNHISQIDDWAVCEQDLKNVDFTSRYIGCCGADGSVLNVFNNNKQPVGYQYGDCYMPHFVRIPKQFVTIQSADVSVCMILFATVEYRGKIRIVDRIMGDEVELMTQRLKKQSAYRLKQEIDDAQLRNELMRSLKVIDIEGFTVVIEGCNTFDDVWLYTKYDNF